MVTPRLVKKTGKPLFVKILDLKISERKKGYKGQLAP